MNFQQALQIKGQKDNKGYDLKVTMLARFGANMEFGQTQTQKPKCSVKLTDANNETHKVYLYGTLPTPAMCTQRAEFLISAFDGQGQQGSYVGYSGFWNSRATVAQDSQPSSQQTSQSTSRQETTKPVDWDAKELREHRGYALHDACTILIALAELNQTAQGMSSELAMEMAELFVKYRYNGLPNPANQQTQLSGENPDWVGDDPLPVGDSDIPF